MPPHAVSVLEAQVKWRMSYLILAVLLRFLDVVVLVCFSKATWIASAATSRRAKFSSSLPHWKPLR
jgi:hypothetical protein